MSAGVGVFAVLAAVGANVRQFPIGDSGANATWHRVHLTSRDRGRDHRHERDGGEGRQPGYFPRR